MIADSPISSAELAVAFGKALRERRAAAGFSQEGFAFQCGLDRTYVSGVERGVRNPTLQVAQKLAAGLGQNLSDLIKRAEEIMEGGAGAL